MKTFRIHSRNLKTDRWDIFLRKYKDFQIFNPNVKIEDINQLLKQIGATFGCEASLDKLSTIDIKGDFLYFSNRDNILKCYFGDDIGIATSSIINILPNDSKISRFPGQILSVANHAILLDNLSKSELEADIPEIVYR